MSFPGIDNPDSLFAIRAETVPMVHTLLERADKRQSSMRNYDATA